MTKHVTILLIHYLFIIAYRLSFLLFVTNEVFREEATELEEKLGMNSEYFACLVSLVQRIWRNTGNQAKFAFLYDFFWKNDDISVFAFRFWSFTMNKFKISPIFGTERGEKNFIEQSGLPCIFSAKCWRIVRLIYSDILQKVPNCCRAFFF